MAMIRSLPPEYSSFASSLQLLDKFEKTKLQEAFVAEEILRSRSSAQDSTPSASVLAATTPFNSNNLVCEFCSLQGHSQVPATAIASRRLRQHRTHRRRLRNAGRIVSGVVKALPTLLPPQTCLLPLLLLRNSLEKQVFVPIYPLQSPLSLVSCLSSSIPCPHLC